MGLIQYSGDGIFTASNSAGGKAVPTGFEAQVTDQIAFTNGEFKVGTTVTGGTADAKVLFRGDGSTTGNHFRIQSANTLTRFLIKDDGKIYTGSGRGIVESAGFQQVHSTKTGSFGVGIYGYDHTSAGVSIQAQTSTPIALLVGISASGVANPIGINSSCLNGSSSNRAIYGRVRSGASYAAAIDGEVINGGTAVSSLYATAVRGTARASVDSLQYGGYFAASFNSISTVYTKNVIGVGGLASSGTTGHAASTSIAIGGDFKTTTSGGTSPSWKNIALRIPNTGNDGNVVIGADVSSVNQSMVEVTGAIESLSSADGIIMVSSDGTRYRIIMANDGTLNIAAA